MRFQMSPLLKPFSEVSVFIGVSGVFVWIIDENVSKSMRFKRKRICVDGAYVSRKWNIYLKDLICPIAQTLTTLCDIRPVSINFQKAKTTIKTKRVGTNSHLRCFPTHATDKKYARTISIRFPPQLPYNVEPA